MPFGLKPFCSSCKSCISAIWRKGNKGEVLCNACGIKIKSSGKVIDTQPNIINVSNGNNVSVASNCVSGTNGSLKSLNGKSTTEQIATRKSNRIKISRHKYVGGSKSLSAKGKGRRSVYKKIPVRSCMSVSTVVTSDYVFHNNVYYQKGDIVSLVDHSGDIFYAQLRGFLTDQFSNKSAVMTWLLPTRSSPLSHFDISTYILGPEEDIPRKMEYMDFVCHCSSEYFKSSVTPYITHSSKPELSYIWTSVGGNIIDRPSTDEIFGLFEYDI